MTDETTAVTAESEAGFVVQATETAESGPAAEPTADSGAVQATAERELTGILEALLFMSPDPLSIQRLMSVIGDVNKAELTRALQRLGRDLEQEGRGVRLAEIAGGYRLVTKQEYASWIKRLDKAKSTAKLSRSALESLAIIAYKQPIVKSEIEEIRGVEASGVVRTLLERKLVRIVGRKEVPGRPIMYGTTKYFLEHFGLNDLSQLPPLREFKELGESEQSMLPMGDVEGPVMEGAIEPAQAVVSDQECIPAEAGEATALLSDVETPAVEDPTESVEAVEQELASDREGSSTEAAEAADPLKAEDELVGEPVE